MQYMRGVAWQCWVYVGCAVSQQMLVDSMEDPDELVCVL